jgi:hypothetical protein
MDERGKSIQESPDMGQYRADLYGATFFVFERGKHGAIEIAVADIPKLRAVFDAVEKAANQ